MGRWPEDGIIYCTKEQCLCMGVNIKTGICKFERCNIHDPDYIAEKNRQLEKLRQNNEKAIEHKREDKEATKNIRNQHRIEEDMQNEEISSLEERCRYLYKIGRTRAAQDLELELAEKLRKKRLVQQS
ncbi:MAG: hypothetical protein RSA49_05125 [Anaerovoracaceae bacterium]